MLSQKQKPCLAIRRFRKSGRAGDHRFDRIRSFFNASQLRLDAGSIGHASFEIGASLHVVGETLSHLFSFTFDDLFTEGLCRRSVLFQNFRLNWRLFRAAG